MTKHLFEADVVSRVVWAIREGRLCAPSIDRFFDGNDEPAAVSS